MQQRLLPLCLLSGAAILPIVRVQNEIGRKGTVAAGAAVALSFDQGPILHRSRSIYFEIA